jgi:hypothetical protein
MNLLHFVTASLIDLMEMSVLGLGSKRGDDTKIGHKGSGMKFAFALIHRLGSSLYVTINGRRWHSQLRTITVRGAEHQIIVLVADDGEVRDLNIVLQAGADTWTSPWYVLRELLQNCLDEGGYFADGDKLQLFDHPGTIMSLAMTEQLQDAWDNRGEWYHRRQPGIIYDRGNQPGGLFYHGFRISTEEGWTYCYDVTDIISRENLSEDRQAKGINNGDLFRKIVQHSGAEFLPSTYTNMARYKGADNDDIEQLLIAVYQIMDHNNSDVGNWQLARFEDAFIAIHGEKVAYTINTRITERQQYYAASVGVTIIHVNYRVGYVLNYSKRIKQIDSHIPELAARLKPVRASDLDLSVKERLRAAERMTRSMRPLGCKVDIVDTEFRDDASDGAICAKADIEANRVLIMRRWAEKASTQELVEGLIEEYAHINSKSGDGCINFEKHLIRIIAAKVMKQPKALGTEAVFAL